MAQYYGSFGYNFFSGRHGYIFPATTFLSPNRVALSFDGSSSILYINGSLVTSFNENIEEGLFEVFTIGSSNAGNYLFGHISNLRIYDRCLTPIEIALA